MVSKLKFLGVAVGAARKFASLTAATFATLTAAVFFAGCDEAKDLADSAKSLAASVSIEQPIVTIESKAVEQKIEVPIFGLVGSGEYAAKYFVKIVSKDNATKLENVVINRGNCGVKKWQINKQAYQDYTAQNPDYVFAGEGTKLATKSGELVNAKQGIFTDGKSLEFFNSLDDKAKAIYELAPEFRGEALPFGSAAIFYPNCKADSIIEIELTANGGKFVYSFEQRY